MPLLNFEKRFAEKIESGEKRQTIRAYRKYPIREGDKLYLFTGLRNRNCRKLKTKFDKIDSKGKTYVPCNSVQNIRIHSEYSYKSEISHSCDIFNGAVYIDNNKLDNKKIENLVIVEGFYLPEYQTIEDSVSDFFEYFGRNYGSDFEGQLIKW